MKPRMDLPMLLILAMTCLSACIPQKSIPRVDDPGQPAAYISERYILCTLTDPVSPSVLAQTYLGDADKYWMIEDSNPGARYLAGETIVIPRVMENRAGLFKDGYQTVPILCYHQFSEKCASQLCMPTAVFKQQMQYLKDNHYRVISMRQLLEYLSYKAAIPQRSVVITVDDGYKSFYNIAFPILKQYGFVATLFIYTDFISGGSALTWEQLREIKAAGFEVGSHTLSHADLALRKKTETRQTYIQRIRDELVQSKKILDQKLSQDTTLFAYPFGSSSQTVVELCQEAGYTAAVTVDRGGNPFFNNPFNLQRDQILSRDPATFISRVSSTFHAIRLEDKARD